MKRLSKILCLLIFTNLSCGEDEVFTKNIFSITVEDGAWENSTLDNWIILHNTEGEIIDFKKLEVEKMIEFNSKMSLPKNQISVTYLQVVKTTSGFFFNFKTHQNIDLFETWTLKRLAVIANSSCPESIGRATIKLNGFPLGFLNRFSLSNKYSCAGGGSSFVPQTGLYELDVTLTDIEDKYLLSFYDDDGIPYYTFIENIKDGEAIELSYKESFKAFDIIIESSFSNPISQNGLVRGFELNQSINDNSGYLLNFYYDFMGPLLPSPIKLGYLKSINKYESSYSISYDSYFVGFSKSGDPIKEINPPVESFSITDRSLDSFNYSSVGNCQLYDNSYYYNYALNNSQISISWFIQNSGTGKRSPVTKLPEEILTKYFQLNNLNNLTHSGSRFVIKSSMTYKEHMGVLYKNFAANPKDEIVMSYK